jgi:hypothetical protein
MGEPTSQRETGRNQNFEGPGGGQHSVHLRVFFSLRISFPSGARPVRVSLPLRLSAAGENQIGAENTLVLSILRKKHNGGSKKSKRLPAMFAPPFLFLAKTQLHPTATLFRQSGQSLGGSMSCRGGNNNAPMFQPCGFWGGEESPPPASPPTLASAPHQGQRHSPVWLSCFTAAGRLERFLTGVLPAPASPGKGPRAALRLS